MLVAEFRGVQFSEGSGIMAGYLRPKANEEGVEDTRAFEALRDVAYALGYTSYHSYNVACELTPTDVRERLARL